MNELLSFLSAIHPLSPEPRAHLESILRVQECKKKELLLDIGQVCRNIYFVESGLFRCYYINKEKEVCSWFMKEGDVIASVGSFYRQRPSYERIQALETSRVYYISFDQLQEIYLRYPEFNYHGRVLTEKYYQLWDERLHLLQMDRVKERYLYLREHHPELERRVPRGDLASWLGITLETLSRMVLDRGIFVFAAGELVRRSGKNDIISKKMVRGFRPEFSGRKPTSHDYHPGNS